MLWYLEQCLALGLLGFWGLGFRVQGLGFRGLEHFRVFVLSAESLESGDSWKIRCFGLGVLSFGLGFRCCTPCPKHHLTLKALSPKTLKP